MCCGLSMNGKSEDKPFPSSLVVETEKPVREKAFVEVEYFFFFEERVFINKVTKLYKRKTETEKLKNRGKN